MVYLIFVVFISLVHPESAFYCSKGIFISDIGNFGINDGKIWLKKGNKISAFINGLKDPKGIFLHKGKIYVTDVVKIWEIDIKTKEKKELIKPSDFQTPPQFLNDIFVSEDGKVYFSDTFKDAVFVFDLKTKKLKMLFRVDKPNGIWVREGIVYVVTFTRPGKLYKFKNGKLTLLYKSKNINGGDGLCIRGKFAYISGYYSGKIVRYNLINGKAKVIKSGLKTPADIFVKGNKMGIPLLEAGKFVEIKIK